MTTDNPHTALVFSPPVKVASQISYFYFRGGEIVPQKKIVIQEYTYVYIWNSIRVIVVVLVKVVLFVLVIVSEILGESLQSYPGNS